MARDIRYRSERLANLLNSPPFPGQADEVKRYLSEFGSNGSVGSGGLINYQIQRYNGRTAVHIAANNGLFECLEELLRLGGNPNAVSSRTDLCQTPLHLAATKGYARCLQVLLEYRADMFMENSYRVKPTELVSGKKMCEKVFQHAIAKITIPARTREQQQRVVDMHQYIEDGEEIHLFYQMYERLPPSHLDLAARWNDLSQTLLYRACAKERLDVVQFLLSRSSSTPLHNLSGNNSPIHVTCLRGNHGIASSLLNHSPKLMFTTQSENKTALHIACSKGDLQMVDLIFDCIRSPATVDMKEVESLPPDMQDNLGRTPFFIACYYGYIKIVRNFCQLKEDLGKALTFNVNCPLFETKRTPLHAAVCKNSIDTVHLLIALEETNKNVEARPSSKTQERLLHDIEKKRHGRILTPSHTVVQSDSIATPPPWSPHETPLCVTPVSNFGTYVTSNSHESESNSCVSAASAASPSATAFTVPQPRKLPNIIKSVSTDAQTDFSLPDSEPSSPKSRTFTDISGIELGEPRALGIFEETGGELVIGVKGKTSGKSFNQLYMTPLAEACALGYTDIVNALFSYGAYDESGLACRIAHLAHNYDLMQSILARSCSIIREKIDLNGSSSSSSMPGLSLEWEGKKLPEVRSEWFRDSAVYIVDDPSVVEEQTDKETDVMKEANKNLRRIEPLQLRRLTLSEMPIRRINFAKNNLKSLPLEIFHLEHLTELALMNNRLVELPVDEAGGEDGGWRCKQLELLNLSRNNLVKLPSCLWVLPSLKKICVSHNNLASFSVSDVPNGELSKFLTSIDLSYNSITPTLPPFFFQFPSLKRAFFQHNKLMHVPSTIWQCPTLQELTLNDNELESLPWCDPHTETDTNSSPHLEHTIFQQSDQVLTGMVQVKPNAAGNPFSKQKSSLYRSIKAAGVQELSWVNYSAVNTESYDYSALTKLDVSKNRLSAFPEALPCLAPNLTELLISHNKIPFIDVQYVPQSIKKIISRNCEVELVGNVIKPEQFKQVVKSCRCPIADFHGRPCQHRNHPRLDHLIFFNLSNNKVKHFQLIHHPPYDQQWSDPGEYPKEKEFQSSLSSLDLLYPALENLDLSRNCLQGLFNPNIGHQTHLKSIKLHSNPDLERIPFEFSCLKKSKDFTELTMNDLPKLYKPPREYQTAGLTHVLTYMRSCLKESVPHRTIKLFFIGNGERGKTTLLRRLRGLPDEKIGRTEGIEIEDWHYPEPSRFSFSAAKLQVHFLAWDFAGQDVYYTTHQCFYSRRSLYLALFRLTDGIRGVDELDPWLRNVKLRAPGSVVVIVGTHMDLMKEQQGVKELEEYTLKKYTGSKDTNHIYPKVVHVTSVSSKKRATLFYDNNMEKLRAKLYDIACHLQLASDGVTLEYKKDCKEEDPKCLFQQHIPQSFLNLQDRIRKIIATFREDNRVPIMEEGEFRINFKDLFDDDEEMNEAVFFLNLQGTILHFEDHGLKETYFLDPQWLAKLMASIIRPAAEEGKSPIKKGMGVICDLFQGAPDKLKRKYIQLLEKFEVALQLTDTQVIIPSLMPPSAEYPKPNDTLKDISLNVDNFYQATMRRFWLADFIPNGFWPRLICRIATDHQIGKTLRNVIKTNPKMSSAHPTPKHKLNWIPWRSGIAFIEHGRTLLVVREVVNEKPPQQHKEDSPPLKVKNLPGDFRIEVHVYVPDWITLVNECAGVEEEECDPFSLPAMATQLLIMISQHIETLASDWFPGMLLKENDLQSSSPAHLPCWKCYGQMACTREIPTDVKLENTWVYHNARPVYCFGLTESIVPAALGHDLECPLHGKIEIVHTAPDLIFWDLANSSMYYQDNSISLRIDDDRVLGKGGYGFVCEGELVTSTHNMQKKKVAVKVFLQEMGDVDQLSIAELLERSKLPRHLLHAYREIRQEVAFLSALDHPHLTQLCGVRTTPHMCLMLELAPLGSLRNMLKEYQNNNLVLEPLTLKTTTLQIAEGLEFLHKHQIVHLDMKSPNVLVWYFPSAECSHSDRVRHAGNVWLKLADYGISQVSTGFVMRVRNTPVGTPGYMAPELFEQLGQQVSSEKVDVFGFGMTLYELLSLHPPFGDIIPPFKRNLEIRDKHRPLLKAKQTRSLVLLQDLMRLCWHHDADERPRMAQVKEWVASEEFERLRAEVALSDIKLISCARVCRIVPENEVEFRAEQQYSCQDPYLKEISEKEEEKYLPSVLDDSDHVENTQDTEQDICMDEEDVYRFVPLGRPSSQPGFTLDHAYTQIWMCGRDQKKGLLHIFTYYDGQAGFHTFSGYCSKEEVSALCAVRNMMWMGTSMGTLKVFHAPTLKAKFTGMGGARASCILDILHLEKTSSVLVSTISGDIWSFHDRLSPHGLRIQCRLALTDCLPCYHLVAVETDESVEVWGTLDNSQLCLLEKDGNGWKSQEIRVKTGDPKLRVCSHIILASFRNKKGVTQNHLWISYRSRGVLVAWDVSSRQQRAVVNCNSFPQLKSDKDTTLQVTSLAAHGRKVFVGTDSGTVGILDSETQQLTRVLHWYEGKVRTLLVMPKEVECCICAEVPTQPDGKKLYKKPQDLRNPHNTANVDRNAVMVTTFGNGRRKFSVHTVTKSERTKQFDKEFQSSLPPAKRSSLPAKRSGHNTVHEDVSLLSWKS